MEPVWNGPDGIGPRQSRKCGFPDRQHPRAPSPLDRVRCAGALARRHIHRKDGTSGPAHVGQLWSRLEESPGGSPRRKCQLQEWVDDDSLSIPSTVFLHRAIQQGYLGKSSRLLWQTPTTSTRIAETQTKQSYMWPNRWPMRTRHLYFEELHISEGRWARVEGRKEGP